MTRTFPLLAVPLDDNIMSKSVLFANRRSKLDIHHLFHTSTICTIISSLPACVVCLVAAYLSVFVAFSLDFQRYQVYFTEQKPEKLEEKSQLCRRVADTQTLTKAIHTGLHHLLWRTGLSSPQARSYNSSAQVTYVADGSVEW